MTVTLGRTTADPHVPPPPARLSLTPGAAPCLLDGAWWPRSRDLGRELPALLERLERRWGRIARVTVQPAFWSALPREVPVAAHAVRVGRFAAGRDRYKLLLLSPAGRWDLLIVPPETGPAAAGRLLSAASLPGGLLTAGELMDDERAAADVDRPGAGEESWESEGGAPPAPAGRPATARGR
ncbi:DUF5994 family protein [Streptomyces huiliensis]|uniref:DUF5994 family protein n=1 Tax=Streptomyces huiliensis TaxID=2876027 RepID=UPI001CBD1230|nr:DUF5994 family protein [Streptomyces huiliensis]MBZ4319386.1 DUF5994 family protein [Streptomyces huiliensis]